MLALSSLTGPPQLHDGVGVHSPLADDDREAGTGSGDRETLPPPATCRKVRKSCLKTRLEGQSPLSSSLGLSLASTSPIQGHFPPHPFSERPPKASQGEDRGTKGWGNRFRVTEKLTNSCELSPQRAGPG